MEQKIPRFYRNRPGQRLSRASLHRTTAQTRFYQVNHLLNKFSGSFILLVLVDRDQPTERQVRIQLKDHIDRCKKRKQEKERDDYRYSGSENEEEEPQVAGEPSSIIQAPGGDTLRRNFQQIQEGRTLVEPPPRYF